MPINTNKWNTLRYTFIAPAHDFILAPVNHTRKKSIDALNLKPGNKVLIIGAGTGLDLPHIPKGCNITAIDITPAMVVRIRKRAIDQQLAVGAHVMDGQKLSFEDERFDAVILHLILAVIPDPIACIQEVQRVLVPNGKVAVYDKFVPKGNRASRLRRGLNLISNVLATDITRSFEQIVSQTALIISSDEPAQFKGNLRLIQLKKAGRP